jgi:hypothetical protein
MSCNPELVSAFLDEELDPVIIDTVTRHLLNCDDCLKTLSELAFARVILSTHPARRCPLPDPERTTTAIMSAIRNEKTTPMPSSSVRNIRRWLHEFRTR